MKRNLFLLIAVAAALSACSKTETIGTQDKAIQFTSAYIGNAVESKAVNMIEQANINEFIVYGGYNNDMTHVFDGVSVTRDANTDNWTYDVTRYWVAGKTYKFAAYAPSGAAGSSRTITPDFGTGALNFTDYTSDPSNQNDLIYATATQTTESDISVAPAKIQFVFGHLLSMIKFTFNSGFGNDIKVTVDNLKVYGMIAQGNYAGGSWTPGSATVTEGAPFSEMSSNEAENLTSGNTSASSVDFAVIPQTIVGSDGTGTKVAVSFNVRVQDAGGDYIIGSADAGVTLTAKLPGYTWTAGNRYNYTVTIKGENVNLYPIEFGKPSVTPITDADFDGSDEVTLPTA